jgi:hypothetical protein
MGVVPERGALLRNAVLLRLKEPVEARTNAISSVVSSWIDDLKDLVLCVLPLLRKIPSRQNRILFIRL